MARIGSFDLDISPRGWFDETATLGASGWVDVDDVEPGHIEDTGIVPVVVQENVAPSVMVPWIGDEFVAAVAGTVVGDEYAFSLVPSWSIAISSIHWTEVESIVSGLEDTAFVPLVAASLVHTATIVALVDEIPTGIQEEPHVPTSSTAVWTLPFVFVQDEPLVVANVGLDETTFVPMASWPTDASNAMTWIDIESIVSGLDESFFRATSNDTIVTLPSIGWSDNETVTGIDEEPFVQRATWTTIGSNDTLPWSTDETVTGIDEESFVPMSAWSTRASNTMAWIDVGSIVSGLDDESLPARTAEPSSFTIALEWITDEAVSGIDEVPMVPMVIWPQSIVLAISHAVDEMPIGIEEDSISSTLTLPWLPMRDASIELTDVEAIVSGLDDESPFVSTVPLSSVQNAMSLVVDEMPIGIEDNEPFVVLSMAETRESNTINWTWTVETVVSGLDGGEELSLVAAWPSEHTSLVWIDVEATVDGLEDEPSRVPVLVDLAILSSALISVEVDDALLVSGLEDVGFEVAVSNGVSWSPIVSYDQSQFPTPPVPPIPPPVPPPPAPASGGGGWPLNYNLACRPKTLLERLKDAHVDFEVDTCADDEIDDILARKRDETTQKLKELDSLSAELDERKAEARKKIRSAIARAAVVTAVVYVAKKVIW